MREHSKARNQHLVAGGQRVGDGRFPAARAGGGEGDDFASRGFEDLFDVFKQRPQQINKVRRAVVTRLQIHGGPQPIWNIRRAGNEDWILVAHGTASGWDERLISDSNSLCNFSEKTFHKK